MVKARSIALTLVGAALGAGGVWVYGQAVAAGPNGQVPELKALEAFAGKWQGEFAGRNGGASTNVEGTAEWVLDGRFLLTKNVNSSQRGQSETLTYWTYDTRAKCYKRWVFTSFGIVFQEEGQWDDNQQKFAFNVTGLGDGSGIATARVIDPDTRQWSYVFKNKDGQITAEISGTNRRRK